MSEKSVEDLNKDLKNYEKAKVEERSHYICHGAKTSCNMGTREARLIVKKSHGVYIKKRAQLNKEDFISNVNIMPMGICKCSSNPNNKQDDVKNEEDTPEEKIDAMIGDIVEVFTETDADRAEDELAQSSLCTPMINMPWQGTKDNLIIGGKETLLDTSVINCAYGGKITITFDGQEE